MTVIAPLVLSPPAAAARGADVKPQPGAAFDALLDRGSPQLGVDAGTVLPEAFDTTRPMAAQSASVFGFDELGIFGRYGAAFVSSQADVLAGPSNASDVGNPNSSGTSDAAEPASGSVFFEPTSSLSANPVSISKPAAEPMDLSGTVEPAPDAPVADPESQIRAGVAPETDGSESAWASLEASRATTGEDETIGPLEGTAGLDGDMPAATKDLPAECSPVSVLVAGPDDALSVVLRGAFDGSDGVAALRKLAEETAAEFDMRVAEFHLNGSTYGSVFRTMTGGSLGSRGN